MKTLIYLIVKINKISRILKKKKNLKIRMNWYKMRMQIVIKAVNRISSKINCGKIIKIRIWMNSWLINWKI